jgi:hypothetical protein
LIPSLNENVGDVLAQTIALRYREQMFLPLRFRSDNQCFVVKTLGTSKQRTSDVD